MTLLRDEDDNLLYEKIGLPLWPIVLLVAVVLAILVAVSFSSNDSAGGAAASTACCPCEEVLP